MCRYPTFDSLQMCQQFIITRKRPHITEIHYTNKKKSWHSCKFFSYQFKIKDPYSRKTQHTYNSISIYSFIQKINKSITLHKSATSKPWTQTQHEPIHFHPKGWQTYLSFTLSLSLPQTITSKMVAVSAIDLPI